MEKLDQLSDLIKFKGKINIVDIGANPLLETKHKNKNVGQPEFQNYYKLLEKDYVYLTAFEADENAYNDFLKLNKKNSRCFNYAIGDGSKRKLYITKGSGMISTLEPYKKTFDVFNIYKKQAEVNKTIDVQTRKLDDIEEIENIDYLKIDIQGGELDVFKNGKLKLKKTLFIDTEVSFINLYNNEPTIGEVDIELRKFGLEPHTFRHISKNIIAPMVINNDPFKHLNQIVQADIIYVKDFREFEKLDDDDLKKICLIAHYCYSSWDLAFKCIHSLIERKNLSKNIITEYQKVLSGM